MQKRASKVLIHQKRASKVLIHQKHASQVLIYQKRASQVLIYQKNVQKRASQIFLDPIQKRAPARSVQLEAVYLEALLAAAVCLYLRLTVVSNC